MPLINVPIVHKFGIISHSQRLELQERLLKEAYAKIAAKKESSDTSKNPCEITEDFINQYNASVNTAEYIKFDKIAVKILERVKRRIGITTYSVGSHVNIPFGWTELTLLAQCKGSIHQDCLNHLLLSLHQAPVNKNQIPALFYLAETVLYWLQTENAGLPEPKASEFKLLQIGEVVLYRLYYHHISGFLNDDTEAKSRLAVYLEGFDGFATKYDAYPDSKLSFVYISTVGKMLTFGVNTAIEQASSDSSIDTQPPAKEKDSPAKGHSVGHETGRLISEGHSQEGGGISGQVHRLSSSLWHTLDVWRCVVDEGGDLAQALAGLCDCVNRMGDESWIDVYLSTSILFDAARSNLHCLTIAQSILYEILFVWKHTANDKAGKLKVGESDAPTNRSTLDDVTIKTNDVTTLRADAASATVSDDSSAHQWTWKVAVAMTRSLCQVALHGSTSQIRTLALTSSSGASLVELVHYSTPSEDSWSWKIRYMALKCLVTLSEASKGEPTRESLRNATLDAVYKSRSKERDPRVLDAVEKGQLQGSVERLLNSYSQSRQPTFITRRIARCLIHFCLPPLAPISPASGRLQRRTVSEATHSPRSTKRAPHVQFSPHWIRKDEKETRHNNSMVMNPESRLRTSLREEIDLASYTDMKPDNYFKRQDFTLFRVVEDQWRKDLHVQMELEEAGKCAELDEIQAKNHEKIAKLQPYKDRRAVKEAKQKLSTN